MIVKASNNFVKEWISEGTHDAVCYALYDLGFQEGEYKGKKTINRKLVLAWQVKEKIEGNGDYQGKHKVCYRQLTASLGEKAELRSILVSWRGKQFSEEELQGFDLSKLIGAKCRLSIAHKYDAYGNVTGINISQVLKATPQHSNFTPDKIDKIPKWIMEAQDRQINKDPEEFKPQQPVQTNIANEPHEITETSPIADNSEFYDDIPF